MSDSESENRTEIPAAIGEMVISPVEIDLEVEERINYTSILVTSERRSITLDLLLDDSDVSELIEQLENHRSE